MSDRLLDDLATAIEQNDATLIKSLLANRDIDANVCLPRRTEPPALVHAAWFGRVDIVELLLNAGARIDDVDIQGRSACHAAAVGDRTDVMCALLGHRPNLGLRNVDGETALQFAIKSLAWSVDDIALLLIRAGAPLDDIGGEDLCRLAANSTSAVLTLMDHGVVVADVRDDLGQTPLHWAVRFESEDLAVLRLLVDVCGVDLEARTNDNERKSCTDIAVLNCRLDALRLFLLAGVDVNCDVAGWDEPLLHKAITSNGRDIACLMLLLAAGADVASRDRNGRTACLLAARVQPTPMMSFVHAMLAVGADLDAPDENDDTPRQWLNDSGIAVDAEQVESARREIAKMRLDFVRHRAVDVCIGLQSLRLDALQLCEILQRACGPLARVIGFHHWWRIATTVKHFSL
jgi:ankyrin repeat protein